MEKLKAAMVVYVAYYKSLENKYFYNICCRDMDGWYHNLLFRPEKMKEIQKEWSINDALYCIGKLVLLQDGEGGNIATLMQTKSNNLGHHNDNTRYSLVDSEILWEIGNNGT